MHAHIHPSLMWFTLQLARGSVFQYLVSSSRQSPYRELFAYPWLSCALLSEIAANVLRGFGIVMNEHLLQNITHRFARLAKNGRTECHVNDDWQKPGLNILICVDGRRICE